MKRLLLLGVAAAHLLPGVASDASSAGNYARFLGPAFELFDYQILMVVLRHGFYQCRISIHRCLALAAF